MERTIEIGNIYKHFKGHVYRVINIAVDSETLKKVVVYQNIDNGEVWVRDSDMFNSLVDKKKYPNVEQEYRFDEVKNGN